jgi:hypothetical protein
MKWNHNGVSQVVVPALALLFSSLACRAGDLSLDLSTNLVPVGGSLVATVGVQNVYAPVQVTTSSSQGESFTDNLPSGGRAAHTFPFTNAGNQTIIASATGCKEVERGLKVVAVTAVASTQAVCKGSAAVFTAAITPSEATNLGAGGFVFWTNLLTGERMSCT